MKISSYKTRTFKYKLKKNFEIIYRKVIKIIFLSQRSLLPLCFFVAVVFVF
jgi:hypothetical protein